MHGEGLRSVSNAKGDLVSPRMLAAITLPSCIWLHTVQITNVATRVQLFSLHTGRYQGRPSPAAPAAYFNASQNTQWHARHPLLPRAPMTANWRTWTASLPSSHCCRTAHSHGRWVRTDAMCQTPHHGLRSHAACSAALFHGWHLHAEPSGIKEAGINTNDKPDRSSRMTGAEPVTQL